MFYLLYARNHWFIDNIYTSDSKCKSKLNKLLREPTYWAEKVICWWSPCHPLLRTRVWIHSTNVNAGQVWKLASNPRAHIPGAICLGQLAESLSSGFKQAVLPQYIRWRAIKSYWRTHLMSDTNHSPTHAHTHIYTYAHTQKGPKTCPLHTLIVQKKGGNHMSPTCLPQSLEESAGFEFHTVPVNQQSQKFYRGILQKTLSWFRPF